jgi:hypothetical protein
MVEHVVATRLLRQELSGSNPAIDKIFSPTRSPGVIPRAGSERLRMHGRENNKHGGWVSNPTCSASVVTIQPESRDDWLELKIAYLIFNLKLLRSGPCGRIGPCICRCYRQVGRSESGVEFRKQRTPHFLLHNNTKILEGRISPSLSIDIPFRSQGLFLILFHSPR